MWTCGLMQINDWLIDWLIDDFLPSHVHAAGFATGKRLHRSHSVENLAKSEWGAVSVRPRHERTSHTKAPQMSPRPHDPAEIYVPPTAAAAESSSGHDRNRSYSLAANQYLFLTRFYGFFSVLATDFKRRQRADLLVKVYIYIYMIAYTRNTRFT